MQISVIPLDSDGETRQEFDLSTVGPCYPCDDVIYFDGVPCVLSSAQTADPMAIFSSPNSASSWINQVFSEFTSAQQQNEG